MIDTPGLSVNFLKKETYTGSHAGMRYYFCKSDDVLKVCAYPEPYCFEVTPEDQKTWKEFAFSPEGLAESIAWLDSIYENYRS